MLNNNGHPNSSCLFAGQSAAYLYKEIAEPEKIAFESHLQGCHLCAEELADFSALSSSILEWRAADFEPLQTPFFVSPAAGKAARGKLSLTESIRAFFSFPGLRATFAALVVLILLTGIFFFASDYFHPQELAEMETSSAEQVQSQFPIPEPTAGKIAVKNDPAPSPGKNSATKSAATNEGFDVKNSSAPVRNQIPAAAKSSYKAAPPKRTANPRVIKPAVNNNAPAIDADDDDDDNSLRLSDIFEEVGINQMPAQEENQK